MTGRLIHGGDEGPAMAVQVDCCLQNGNASDLVAVTLT